MKIGTDIVQISRIENSILKYGDKFKKRFLSTEEIAMAKSISSLAGYWAAKEAISKALGCGIGVKLAFHDILLKKDNLGAPSFILSDKAQDTHKIKKSSLSISHDGGFAIAVVAIST